jgi:DNA-directed RNA polymerase specialized sigma subunit
MTTPDEELKQAMADFGKNWEALIEQVKINLAQVGREASKAMAKMRQQLEDAQVDRIVAQNPGINPDEVRASVRRTSGYNYEDEGFGGT